MGDGMSDYKVDRGDTISSKGRLHRIGGTCNDCYARQFQTAPQTTEASAGAEKEAKMCSDCESYPCTEGCRCPCHNKRAPSVVTEKEKRDEGNQRVQRSAEGVVGADSSGNLRHGSDAVASVVTESVSEEQAAFDWLKKQPGPISVIDVPRLMAEYASSVNAAQVERLEAARGLKECFAEALNSATTKLEEWNALGFNNPETVRTIIAGAAANAQSLRAERDRLQEALDAIKWKTGFVTEKHWGPDDDYLVVQEFQVFAEDGFRRGQTVEVAVRARAALGDHK